MTTYDCTEAIRDIPGLSLMEVAQASEHINRIDPPVREIEIKWYYEGEIVSSIIKPTETPC